MFGARRLWALSAVTAAAIAAVVAPTAASATESGRLLVRATGSAYQNYAANLAVAAGKTGKFSLEVINTGTQTSQYQLTLTPLGGPAQFAYLVGSTTVTNPKYWTPPIPAGSTAVVTVTATIPAGTPEAYTQALVELATANAPTVPITSQVLAVSMPAPKVPTAPHEVTVKSGSQAAIGGPVTGEYSGAPAIAAGKTAKFTIDLRNGGTTPEIESLHATLNPIVGCAGSNFVVTVKAGSTDVTSAALGAGYASAPVQPGKSVVLTETVKYATADPACRALYTQLTNNSNSEFSQVPIAAS